MGTDAASLLQTIYAAWREQRPGEMMTHLDEDFRFTAHLSADLIPGGDKPRDKEELQAFLDHLLATYDILFYDTGPIIVADGRATVQPVIRYRHKESGKVLETKLMHVWHFAHGKPIALDESYDVKAMAAFLKSLDSDDA